MPNEPPVRRSNTPAATLADYVAASVYRLMSGALVGDVGAYAEVVLAHACRPDAVTAATRAANGHQEVILPRAWTALQTAVLNGALDYARTKFDEDAAERFACMLAIGVTSAVESLADSAAARSAASSWSPWHQGAETAREERRQAKDREWRRRLRNMYPC